MGIGGTRWQLHPGGIWRELLGYQGGAGEGQNQIKGVVMYVLGVLETREVDRSIHVSISNEAVQR